MELLLDPALDDAVRALWRRLHAAGLRSLATHTHPTNRPHITLATTATRPAGNLTLPIPVRLGPPRSLGRALVLAAESPALRDLHATIWREIGSTNPLHAPDQWVPHVSLALTMPPEQHEPALHELQTIPLLYGESVAARTYDSETRTVSPLAPTVAG